MAYTFIYLTLRLNIRDDLCYLYIEQFGEIFKRNISQHVEYLVNLKKSICDFPVKKILCSIFKYFPYILIRMKFLKHF